MEFEKASMNMKSFNKFRSALIIKLILLTGIAYRTICSLKRTDLCIENNIIRINNYEIRLPVMLKENFGIYLKISNELKPDREVLFIEFSGKNMSTKTSTLSYFMKLLVRRGDLNGLIKYAITNMIRVGISETVIMEFTGLKKDILNDCYKMVYNKDTKKDI